VHLSSFQSHLGKFHRSPSDGADNIVEVGSALPCRLGFYDLVQKVIPEDQGLPYALCD
jgi:hypothetical protein